MHRSPFAVALAALALATPAHAQDLVPDVEYTSGKNGAAAGLSAPQGEEQVAGSIVGQ